MEVAYQTRGIVVKRNKGKMKLLPTVRSRDLVLFQSSAQISLRHATALVNKLLSRAVTSVKLQFRDGVLTEATLLYSAGAL
jgi:hypothetical protein